MKKDITKDFKNSAKGVLRDKQKFIPFFLVAFIIEALFFSLFMIGHSVNEFYEYTIREKYIYHYIIEGLNGEDYSNIINRTMSLKPVEKRQVEKIQHEVYRIGNENYHRLYVTLKDTKSSTVNTFLSDVGGRTEKDSETNRWDRYEEEKSYSVTPTPLMNLSDYIGDNNLLIFMLWLAIIGISVFLLVCVYNVRISHYRFMYGVYMTCGAGLRKLVLGALFEMAVVFGIMLLPAFVFACFSVNKMFGGAEMPLVYFSGALILALLSSLLVMCTAIFFPMKKIADSMPIDLITKGGTAEYVRSPRSSANFLTKKFPVFYELLSVRRFAKYYISLLVMCIVFNSLFVVGIYAGGLAETVRETKPATFNLSGGKLTDTMLEEISNLPEIEYTMWEVSSRGASNLSFVEFDPDDAKNASSYTIKADNGKCSTMDFDVEGYNATKLKTLVDEGMATVTGDADAIFLEDGVNRAIISRDIVGIDVYGLDIGDKFTVCVRVVDPSKPDKLKFNQLMTSKDILEELYKLEASGEVVYERIEFEVCAIIDYAKPMSDLRLGLSPSNYERIMGAGAYAVTSAEVYVPDNSTDANDNKAYNQISKIIYTAEDWGIERTYSSYALDTASNTYVMGMFLTVAILVLAGAPVLWLFSQKVFYEKRESEVTLLYRMGAGEKRLLLMFLTGGAFVALISFAVSMLLSYIASVVLLTVVAWILPFFGFKYSWMLKFDFEPWTLLLSAAVCMLCGLVSSLWAYYRGKKERTKTESEYLKEKGEKR